MSEPQTFDLPGTIVTGGGASATAGAHAARLGADRALVVTDPYILSTGIAERIRHHLHQEGVEAEIFSEVQSDPTDANVAAGLLALEAQEAQIVVAVGGGSALDAGKMIAVAKNNPGPVSDFMGYHRVPHAGVPVIAIPTTAGTGSEATRVTVITDSEAHTKMMILDGKLVPAVALVDYELTLTMPQSLTAHVGVDTLTHGIEAYVSALSNPMTEPYALSCIGLVGRNLRRAWGAPEDRAARAAMAVAACQGGIAFANASVCLVHGMSRPLGAVFGVPHGLSNAVLLPAVTAYSLAGAPERYATVARALGVARSDDSVADAGERLLDELAQLNQDLQVPRLRELPGVEEATFAANLAKMASDALASGSPERNPIVPAASDIEAIYRQAW
jgi:alcohol dehydrogenase class IV